MTSKLMVIVPDGTDFSSIGASSACQKVSEITIKTKERARGSSTFA